MKMKTKKQPTAGATKVIKFQPQKRTFSVGGSSISIPLLPAINYFTIA